MRHESAAKLMITTWMDTTICPHCELEFSTHTLNEETDELTPYMAYYCPNCGKGVIT